MKVQRLLYSALLGSVLVTAAACGGSSPPPLVHLPDKVLSDAGNSDAGSSDDAGLPEDAGIPDAGSWDAGSSDDAGVSDAGSPDPGYPDPNDPNNAIKDTDCDGLSDQVEFETYRGNGRKTNPALADSDGDGLPDGLELGIDTPVAGTACVLPKDEGPLLNTDPTLPDTDGDGLLDGVEDANHNGKLDDGETNKTVMNCNPGGSLDKAGTGCEPIQHFINFFGSTSSPAPPTNKTGKLITVHGIVCPAGSSCGCGGTRPCDSTNEFREFNPQPWSGGPQRHGSVVNATGGVLGSILDASSIQASMVAITTDAIGNEGYKLLKPPIGASIKVAMNAVSNPALCEASNIPRSRANGFDFDGSARSVSLFGACRPPSEGIPAVVSYQ